jgi:hypothetical protein
MPLPPAWKVRRELERIRVKAVLFTSRWFHDPIRKPIYDLTARWRLRVTAGRLSLTDRVAVFVIYQPKGLPGSILLTLEHLRQNGYSVLVVSNGPLRPEDLPALTTNAALVMERPNVGYDFGAYRDGIRHLWSLKHDLSRLVLMNDSTWFPLRRDDDSLARMEALGADLAGHIFKTESEEKRGNDHVESHLLMISRDFLQSRDFRRFWSRYRMSDKRPTTIAVGEKAFSQLAIRSGRRVRTLMGREWLMSVLHGLDDASLEQVLRHTIDSFSRRETDLSKVRRLLASEEPWREAYLDWTDKSLRNSMSFLLSAAFVMPALLYGRMGFAKKANDIRFHMAREELLDLEASGMIPPLADEVRFEVAEAVRNWRPPKGQEKTVRPKVAVSGLQASAMGRDP